VQEYDDFIKHGSKPEGLYSDETSIVV